jgi:hypothetical protein
MDEPDGFLDQLVSLYSLLFIGIFVNIGHMIRSLLGHEKSGQGLFPVVELIELVIHSLFAELDLMLVGHRALIEQSHGHPCELDIGNAEYMMDG